MGLHIYVEQNIFIHQTNITYDIQESNMVGGWPAECLLTKHGGVELSLVYKPSLQTK